MPRTWKFRSSVPRCAAPVRERPYPHCARCRAGTVTVTPRRARCRDCSATEILLSTELMLRRADSTEAIGAALVARAGGAGYRSIAAHFDRPESTVRRWLWAELPARRGLTGESTDGASWPRKVLGSQSSRRRAG